MTKEQMIAAISSLNVGDSRALEKRGGAFKDLLKEIVNSIPQGGNEPLIIKGFIDDGEEKVSIEDTIKGAQAYLEGRIVLYKNPESDNITNMVVTCHPYSGIILGDGTNIEVSA